MRSSLIRVVLAILALAGLVSGSLLKAQEQTAQGLVERMLQDVLSSEGRNVVIEGVDIAISGDVSARRIEVRDSEGAWLVIERLNLDWQPLSLLADSLEINAITVERVSVARTPAPNETKVDSPAELTDLTNANIQNLRIDRVELAPALVGQAVQLSIEGAGRIRAEPAEIAFQLQASRTDGSGGDLRADILLDPVSRGLSVDLQLTEPVGGIVAGVLGIRGSPEVDLTLKADGTVDNWSGEFALDLDKERTLTGRAALGSSQAGKRLTIDGSGNMDRLVPLQVGALLGGPAELAGSVVFSNDTETAEIERIRLGNNIFQLRLAGPVDWNGEATDVTLEMRSLSQEALTLIPADGDVGPTAVTGLSADLSVTGNVLAPDWKFSAIAAKLSADQATLDDARLAFAGSGVAPVRNPVVFKGSLSGQLLNGSAQDLPPAVRGPLEITVGGQVGTDLRLAVRELHGAIGKITASVSGNIDIRSPQLDLRLTAETRSPATGNERIDALFAGDVFADGQVMRDKNGVITVQPLRLSASAITARVAGTLAEDSQNLSFAAELTQLERLHQDLSGKLDVSGKLTGSRSAPRLEMTGSGEGIEMLKRALSDPRLTVDLVLSTDTPSGSLEFSGNLDGRPVSLAAELETGDDGTRVLRNLTARAGSAEISGQVRLPPNGTPPVGRFTFDAPDLGDIAPFALTEMTGRASGDVSLSDDRGTSLVRVRINGKDVASDALAFGLVDADLRIEDMLKAPSVTGTARASRVRAAGIRFDQVDLTANETGANAFALDLSASGPDLSIDMTANASVTPQIWTVDIARLRGAMRGIAFNSARTFSLTRKADGQVAVNGLRIAVGSGDISATGRIAPSLSLDVELASLPLAAFADLAGQPGLTGTLDGSARLTGDAARPDGQFRLSGRSVDLAQLQEQGLRAIDFNVDGTMTRGTVNLRADVVSQGIAAADVSGSVRIGPPAMLDLRVDGRSTRQALTNRLAQDGVRFEGDVDFNVRITGRADAPEVTGSARIANATLGDADGRFIVRDANGLMRFNGDRVQIESLSGATGRKGRVDASGEILLDSALTSNLSARVEDGIYTDGTLVSTVFDARLTLTGPLAGSPLVAGELRLEDTKITLSEVPPSALEPLEVRHIHAPERVRRQIALLRSRSGAASSNIRLDIEVVAGDPISISGRGLSVTLGGRLRLTGTLAEPAATGAFRLRRGSMKLLARRLEFESGRLDFFNDLDPRINLVAVSRRTDATIRLVISGRATAPKIDVTASPEMPDEEALAQLIFDRSMLELSPLQIAQLAAAVSTLAGGGGNDLFSGLQNALGLDWIEFTQTPDGESAVGVGKRLNDRLSVGVEQTTQTNVSRVIIDLDLKKNLKLRGAAGSDGSTRAGIFFEKDY